MIPYGDFISQIPDEVQQKTEIYRLKNTVLFKPHFYLSGVTFHVDDYHFTLPSGNSPDLWLNDRDIRTDCRKILAVNPGDVVTCTKGSRAKPYFSFLMKSGLLQSVAEEMEYSGRVKFESDLNPFSAELYQAINNLYFEACSDRRLKLMADSLEIQIAVLILREFKSNVKKLSIAFPDIDSYVNRSIEYMKAYLSSDITIDDICREIHVSPYHYIRQFKKKTGFPPHRYLLNLRVERAKELLGTRNYSVSETAGLCGFVSLPYFSTVFKKFTGCAPGEYR